MLGKFAITVLAAVAVTSGLAGAAQAVECKTKFLVGVWATTDWQGKGWGADETDICLLQFNTSGQVMSSSCFLGSNTKPDSQNLRGRLSVSKACNVTGTITAGKFSTTVTGKLDPKKGKLTLTPKGADTDVYNQQW